MVRHADFARATGIPVYFADARSPWQRGTNEKTIGVLRQYLPRGLDLTTYGPHELQAIAHDGKSRPR